MTVEVYQKLPVEEREHFMQSPDCRKMFDLRSLEDVVFHLAHHKPQRPAFLSRKRCRRRADRNSSSGVSFINWLGVSAIPLRLAEAVAPLSDFRNLALCDHRRWSTVYRRLGLVCVQCRRHLHFGISEFGVLPFYTVIQGFYEGPFISDDGTTCAIFTFAKAADAILGVGLRLLVVGKDV